jgi:hypothetical protein
VDALLQRLAEEREDLDAEARRTSAASPSGQTEGDADHSD